MPKPYLYLGFVLLMVFKTSVVSVQILLIYMVKVSSFFIKTLYCQHICLIYSAGNICVFFSIFQDNTHEQKH